MRQILFLNENTLGHTSYLPAYAREIARHPEWGLPIQMLDVAPLPPELENRLAPPFRGAARLGLTAHYRRWREIASQHAANLVATFLASHRTGAIVVNTQSVALALLPVLPPELPLLLCLDATFAQLRPTPWFAPTLGDRLLQPFFYPPLERSERAVYARTAHFFPWSESVAESLRQTYAVPAEKIEVLPPSLVPPECPPSPPQNSLPRLLFLGGDFRRKGGYILLECFDRYFRGKAELHIVTQTNVPPSPGVFVYHNVRAWTPEWIDLWRRADIFVFPSLLETFGIVLLEAQAFGVPIISSQAGAALDVLQQGQAGWLLPTVSVSSLRDALTQALEDPAQRQQRRERGRQNFHSRFHLTHNAARLCSRIRALTL